MPSHDSNRRIEELLKLAGLDPRTRSSTHVRAVLESMNSRRLPSTDSEFARLLRQIPDRRQDRH